MRQKLAYGSLFVLALSIAYCSLNSPDSRESGLINEASGLIIKVESFKKEKGRLPDTLSEMGIDEREASVSYRREGGKYILWFRTERGETLTFDSETKQWKQR